MTADSDTPRPSRLRDALGRGRVMAIIRYRCGGDVSGAIEGLAHGRVRVRARGLEALPGVATGTEVLTVRRAGVEFFKLFPAGALGPRYLAELRGPFGKESFVPTGGVSLADLGDWLAAGAFAVAPGSAATHSTDGGA